MKIIQTETQRKKRDEQKKNRGSKSFGQFKQLNIYNQEFQKENTWSRRYSKN